MPALGGQYLTEDIQTGTVTAVSGLSLTVRSADGYTKSYQVTSATRVAAGSTESVKVGSQVAVTATVHGSTASLTRVLDLSLLRSGRFAPWGGRASYGQADRKDVWARPGLPRDRAGPRHQPGPGTSCRQAGGQSEACGLRWRPGLAARPCSRS